MKISLYQVDAFTDHVFGGNPAAVCPLPCWLPDEILQKIGEENNLSETAFFVKENEGYRIRWFTPTHEVDLCGHATLAAAFIIFNFIDSQRQTINFFSASGPLVVHKKDDKMQMDFPALPFEKVTPPTKLLEALNIMPREVYRSKDYLVVFNNEAEIKSLQPDITKLNQLDLRGIIVTAPGKETDFVSRFFAPNVGVNEDPVTGSAHCTLMPYWSKKLNKNKLLGHQLSKRGGIIYCEQQNDRILLSGNAALYLQGEITITC